MSRHLALVIGNAHFPNTENLTDLSTPVRDAEGVADTLKQYGDFEVANLLLNQNAATIKLSIEEFFGQVSRGDLALLYYSGHGFKDRLGKLYLGTEDTNTDFPLNTALDASFIKSAVELSSCRHVVVILDSCYSGAFQLGSKGENENLSTFVRALEGETVAVLASSRSGQLSFEGDGDYSKFTQVLLEGIRTSRADKNLDGRITLQELFDYICDNLGEKQLPTLQSGKTGDDIFIARGIEQNLQTVYFASVKEDAYLHTWLTAKLRLAGYDIQSLPGSEEGKEQIRLEHLSQTAAAFVPLISGNALQNDLFMRQIAPVVQIHVHRPIIIPLDAGGWYAEAFKFNPEATCDFTSSWAEGCHQLIAQLEKLKVPKNDVLQAQEVLALWKKDLGVRDSLQNNKGEEYRSNWFEVTLPEIIYIHAFNPNSVLDFDDLGYPVVNDQDYLITFAAKDKFSSAVEIWEDYKVRLDDFLKSSVYVIGDGSTITFPNHKLIDLLSRVLENHFESKGLARYEQSSNSVFYFEPRDGETHKRVSLKSLGHSSTQLSGKMKALTWHYGISAQVFLYPYPAYFLNAHIIFKQDGNLINKKQQHNRRRKKGKDLYNKQWRNYMLAAMLELSDEDSGLIISTGGEASIRVNNQPVAFTSSVGYQEPSKDIELDDFIEVEFETDEAVNA